MQKILVGLALALGLSGSGAKIVWQPSYEAALELAASEQRVVFLVLDHADEGRCERFVDKLLKDGEVLAMASTTANLPVTSVVHGKGKRCMRFRGISCADHVRAEADLRGDVLGVNDKDVVAVPQYVWLDATGKVLLSVPYEIDRDGLLWCFATAQRMLDEETATPLPRNARPPRRLMIGRTFTPLPGDQRGRGMTPAELADELKTTKRNFLGIADEQLVIKVLFTDEPEAVDYVKVQLSFVLEAFARGRLPETVHAIGSYSPASFWEALAEFAEVEESAARHEVAVAFEQLGAPEALKEVKAALKREQEPALERAWVRALAATGPADKGVRKTLLKLLDEDEDEAMRASAAFALGHLERHEDVRAAWSELLAGESLLLRVAAAGGIALARDRAALPALEAAVAATSGDPKVALERALAVLRDGDLASIQADVAYVTGDDIPRERIFFAGGPAPATEREPGR